MHAFFKPALIIFILIFLFFYILINSNTMETKTEVVTASNGMPVQRTTRIYHWDRFSAYIKNTPTRIQNYFSASGNAD